MNTILDTHTLIWFLNGDTELSKEARIAIEDNKFTNFVSIASLWEIAIKISLGKLELIPPFTKFLELILNNGFEILLITFDDTLILSSLPFYHKDPFDRIIISQSITNKFTIISKDKNFESYQVLITW
jgi:PIN domain nuclease of toxin-antitoxin system